MLTTEERKCMVDDAVAHVERAMASARARHDAHVFTRAADQRRQYVARMMAEAVDSDDDTAHDDEDDYIIEFVDERREYGTLWAYNGSVVG